MRAQFETYSLSKTDYPQQTLHKPVLYFYNLVIKVLYGKDF